MGCGLSTHLGSDPYPDAPFLLVGKVRSIKIFLLSRITKKHRISEDGIFSYMFI